MVTTLMKGTTGGVHTIKGDTVLVIGLFTSSQHHWLQGRASVCME